jgi:hypothetical protein
MGTLRYQLITIFALTLTLPACQTSEGRAPTYTWGNGKPAFDTAIGTRTLKGIRKTASGNVPVEAVYSGTTIRANMGKGVPLAVSDKELFVMSLKALATLEFCGAQVAPSFVATEFLNSTLRQASASLGNEQGLIRKQHAIEMQKLGNCMAYVKEIDEDPSVNIFLDVPAKRPVNSPSTTPLAPR